MCQRAQHKESVMFEVLKSSLNKLEHKTSHLYLAKLQFPCNRNFHVFHINKFEDELLQLIKKNHPYKALFSSTYCHKKNLRTTLEVPKLSTIVFIASTCSHIEGVGLINFIDFGTPFVFTFSRMGYGEVVSENTSSWILTMHQPHASKLSIPKNHLCHLH